MRISWLVLLLNGLLLADTVEPLRPQQPAAALTPAEITVIHHISAKALRGRLSFLASDLLEGRSTPSRGLDIAAEYIASEFRRAGLEPGGDDGYFQTAEMLTMQVHPEGFRLKLRDDVDELDVGPDAANVAVFEAIDLKDAQIYKVDLTKKDAGKSILSADLNGKVIVTQSPRKDLPGLLGMLDAIRRARQALVITIGDDAFGGSTRVRLAFPGKQDEKERDPFSFPRIQLESSRAEQFFDALPVGATNATVSVHIDAPSMTPVKLHNVVGILRGSDPKLKDTCVMVTAHYDHLGMKAVAAVDRIYNGANDDGSGTVSVMELADALAVLKNHPRRSIVFVTFFGEEKGDLGSHYYAEHPAIPIAKTVADINLEQVGRTDSTEGPQIAKASLTGFTYSSVTDMLVRAGEMTGVKIYRHPRNSDLYFARSDNQALADVGVPAHTLCVAFDYPDYHAVGDEWPKIDYDNMAKIDRTVAVALLLIANSAQEPRWNEKEPKAASYVKTWQEKHVVN